MRRDRNFNNQKLYTTRIFLEDFFQHNKKKKEEKKYFLFFNLN